MTKLPVLQTVRETWRFIWRQRRDLFYLAAPFVVVLSIVNAVISRLAPQSAGVTDSAEVPQAILLAVPLQIVLGFIVTTLFSVTWHRRYLVPEESLTVGATLSWSDRHWRFLLAMLILFGVYIALTMLLAITMTALLLPFLASSNGPIRAAQFPLLLILAFPILVYCLVRLSLLFPAAAVDERLSLRSCWQRTRGNGWRIFFIYFLASLPLFLLVTAISLIVSTFVQTPDISITFLFLSSLVQQMLYYFSFAVGISVLSHVYRSLTAPGVTSPVLFH